MSKHSSEDLLEGSREWDTRFRALKQVFGDDAMAVRIANLFMSGGYTTLEEIGALHEDDLRDLPVVGNPTSMAYQRVAEVLRTMERTNEDGVVVTPIRQRPTYEDAVRLAMPNRLFTANTPDGDSFVPEMVTFDFIWRSTRDESGWTLRAATAYGPLLREDETYGDLAEGDFFDPYATDPGDKAVAGSLPGWLIKIAEERAKILPKPTDTKTGNRHGG